jgi:DNA-binding transcriptional LysR family regulator
MKSISKEITLRQLRYFLAAAESGQLSMAARQCHVTQSAITAAVQLLERALGVRLFERLPHGVSLTPEGHNFRQQARHIVDSLQDAVRRPRFQSHGLEGVVRIGATYTVLGYFLPALLARFRMQYPGVELDLHDMDRPGIETAILDGSLDLGVVILSNLGARNRFAHHVLMRSRRQLWTPESHPLLELGSLSLADVAKYPYLQITQDESERSTLRYWRSKRLTPRIVFRTGSMEALRGLIAHGFGVTILSDVVYRPWSLEGRKIEARPILDLVPDMEVGLIWQPRAALEGPAQALCQFLIHACGS